MDAKKKLIISISVVAVALVLAITAMVIVLVQSTQSATSKINMQYTVEGVGVRVSANGIIGTASYPLKSGSNYYLDLTPSNTSGTLNQSDEVLTLSNDHSKIIYEYVFTNLLDDVNVEIALSSTPATKTNIQLRYAYSDTKVTDYDSLTFYDTYDSKCLGAGDGTTKYIFIEAKVVDTMSNSLFEGSFSWTLSEAEDVVAIRHIVTTEGNGFLATDYVTYHLSSEKLYEPSYQMFADYYFYGWCYSANGFSSKARISFPKTASEIKNLCSLNDNYTMLFGIYLPGNVPSSCYTYDSTSNSYHVTGQLTSTFTDTTLVIPDIYTGSNGALPVTQVIDVLLNEGRIISGIAYGSNVTSVYIGNNVIETGCVVTQTDEGINYGSGAITLIEFGRNVKIMRSLAGCTNLATVNTPSSLRTIYSAWYNGRRYYPWLYGTAAYASNSVTLQCYDNAEAYILVNGTGVSNASTLANWENVVCIPDKAFVTNTVDNSETYTTTLTTITIPSGCTEIGYCAFYYCTSLTTVTFHNNVTEIGGYAFYECSALQSISIPSVKKIGDYAFYASHLTSITTGKNLKHIGTYAFYYSGLTGFTFKTNELDYLGTRAFGYTPVQYVYNIPAVKTLGDTVFVTCYNLETITIPEGLTRISYSMFNECNSLKQIVIPRSVTSIGNYAFNRCAVLEKVVIPSSVTSIGDSAFGSCTNLKTCNIPDSVTTIGNGAFNGCTSLQSITLPRDLTSIGTNVFYNCTSVTKFYYNVTTITTDNNFDLFSQEHETFYSLGSAGTGIEFVVDKDVTCVPSYLFSYSANVANSANIKTVVFEEESVCELIGDYSFSYLPNLTTVILPESLEMIYSCTFQDATSLTSISIPDRCTFIGFNAFGGCTSLASVDLGGGIENISLYAFRYCAALTSITIPASVTEIGDHCFYNCTALTSVTFEDSTSSWVANSTTISVSNPSTNATYLKNTYSTYTWMKSTE